MSKYREQQLIRLAKEELARRQAAAAQVIDVISAAALPWQADFIKDTHRHKALFGERRGAKTTTMGIAAIDHALNHPHSKILYIGLTSDSTQRAMYDEVLAKLQRNHHLPAKLLGGDEMRFDNGSILYLIGLDANKKQKEKVRGVKASLILIDEMQSYSQDISAIINDVLGPAAADTKAAIILGGTAGNVHKKNYWYQITKDNTKEIPINDSLMHPEWKVYRCMWENNTAIDEQTNRPVCDNVREYLADLIAKHPGIELDPGHRQEWNAEWVVETSSLIYRYTPANLINSFQCLEPGTANRVQMPSALFLTTATYILGVDLGYNDPTAMCVCCYNLKYSNKLYVIETFQASGMLVPDVADKIKELDKLYKFATMVGDSSSLQVFETMKQTYSFPLEKANRAGKLSHQLVLNSDMTTRSVIFMPGNQELIDQLTSCQWKRDALEEGKYIEDPTFKNDLTDSLLYAHHACRHLWYTAPNPVSKFVTKEEALVLLTSELMKRGKPKGLMNQDFATAAYQARKGYGR